MRLADYVMNFLAYRGLKTMFMLPGGGCMHLVDALGRSPISYVTCLHEQAASIAAESYAEHTGGLGGVLVTTGPGGTNAITGLAAAYIDSTPVIFLSGQVKRSDMKGDSAVRQMGSQEVAIVPVVQSLTKYAVTVTEPEKIRSILEEACLLATSGRPGPVWLDIPLDVQAAEIDETALPEYVPTAPPNFLDSAKITAVKDILKRAKRPLLLVGNGVKLAGAAAELDKFRRQTHIPTLLTWKTLDMLDSADEYYFGCPGVMGQRAANFILQNADALIVLGSRLDSSLTAWNHENFASQAKKIIVDIDGAEIEKLKMPLAISLTADCLDVLTALNDFTLAEEDIADWLAYCRRLKSKYPAVTEEMRKATGPVNAHAFIEELSEQLTPNDVIVPESSGGAGEITYQAFKVKKGQKIKNAAGLGSMGFGLPYALGACLANDKRRTILINGDGAFQLNIQELSTIVGLNLPIKIFIWQNGGYASIQNTQRNFFQGNLVGANEASGLFLPDIAKIGAAYGLKTFSLTENSQLPTKIAEALSAEGPVLCTVNVSPTETACPRVKSVKLPNGSMASKPLEDMWPYLSEAEIRENMI